MNEKLIEIKDLKVSFFNEKRSIQVIRGVDLTLNKGELVGILGESGSGKTVTASSILGLMDPEEGKIDAGEILYLGKNLLKMDSKKLEDIRGKQISYVFQNPSQALNPYIRVGNQLLEALKTHKLAYSKEIVINALLEVGLEDSETIYNMYPFQLSGGQNQRIMIAQCIICKPDLLIADEPTSSIDSSLRKKLLDLFIAINKKYNMSIIIITHDFDVARYLCKRLIVMYGGLVLEESNIDDIFNNPLHPYTEELIKCSHSLDAHEKTLYTLDGAPPTPYDFSEECPFNDRCKYKIAECVTRIPEMIKINNRKVRCLQQIIKERKKYD